MKKLLSLFCALVTLSTLHAQSDYYQEQMDNYTTIVVGTINLIDKLVHDARYDDSEAQLSAIRNQNPEMANCYYINSSGRLEEDNVDSCIVGHRTLRYFNVGERSVRRIKCSECVYLQQRYDRCQKRTYLFGTGDVAINSSSYEFERKMSNKDVCATSCDQIKFVDRVWYTREGETQGQYVNRYRAYNAWDEGNAYIYVGTQDNHVKFVDVDFYENRPGGRRHVFGAAKFVFDEDCGYGKVPLENKETDYYHDFILVWNRPDGVRVTVTKRIFKDSNGKIDFDRQRETIRYDVLSEH